MRRFWGYKFRRTMLLTILYAAFVVGVGLAHSGYTSNLNWICLAGAALFIFRKRTFATLVLVIFLGLFLGIWRGSFFQMKLAGYQPYYGQKVTLTAHAINDAVYGKHSQLSFDADHISLEDGTTLTGKIGLSGFGIKSAYQGDEVQATGKLYPGLGSYQARMSYGKLQVVGRHGSLVADLRRKFAAGMQTALPEPLAPFAMGLLIGQRATLPDGIKQELLMVGLTHIIAVSGYNLTIMLRASKGMFGRASKRIATLLSLALIGVFLLLAGASASIVRAAIVSVLSIAAGYYGRAFKPVNLIMLAAAVTAWSSPFYVWSDAGWYLSFLAFYGVLVLAPAIAERFSPLWRRSLVAMVALESICAEMMALPYILHLFGQMSFVGLPANVLVVTLIPLAMLLSLIAGLGGMLAASSAGWFGWPAQILLTYMLGVAHAFSHIPGIFKQGIGLSIKQMLFLYFIAGLISLSLHFKSRPKNVTITDKNQAKNKEQVREWSLEMVNN